MSTPSFILTVPRIPRHTSFFASKPINPSQLVYRPHINPPRCTTTPPSSSGDSLEKPALPNASNETASTDGNELAFVGADRLGISFTCDVNGCGQRVTKSIRRRSYEKGTVLIQCPACGSHHIIADNYGMYTGVTGGKKNLEEIAKDSGAAFARVNADAFGLENIYRKFSLWLSFSPSSLV